MGELNFLEALTTALALAFGGGESEKSPREQIVLNSIMQTPTNDSVASSITSRTNLIGKGGEPGVHTLIAGKNIKLASPSNSRISKYEPPQNPFPYAKANLMHHGSAGAVTLLPKVRDEEEAVRPLIQSARPSGHRMGKRPYAREKDAFQPPSKAENKEQKAKRQASQTTPIKNPVKSEYTEGLHKNTITKQRVIARRKTVKIEEFIADQSRKKAAEFITIEDADYLRKQEPAKKTTREQLEVEMGVPPPPPAPAEKPAIESTIVEKVVKKVPVSKVKGQVVFIKPALEQPEEEIGVPPAPPPPPAVGLIPHNKWKGSRAPKGPTSVSTKKPELNLIGELTSVLQKREKSEAKQGEAKKEGEKQQGIRQGFKRGHPDCRVYRVKNNSPRGRTYSEKAARKIIEWKHGKGAGKNARRHQGHDLGQSGCAAHPGEEKIDRVSRRRRLIGCKIKVSESKSEVHAFGRGKKGTACYKA